jgi:trk system potassium uptake protein TrkH
VFHAVSAFCNAGFSLFAGNMTQFAGDVGVQVVLMVLIVLGGLGFPVLMEVVRTGWQRLRRVVDSKASAPARVGLTTRVVLTTSGVLVVAGMVAVLALEFTGALTPAGEAMTGGRVLGALFASVNARTAGFNTVDLGVMRDATLLLMCALMFIGGSPASTAGGIKTTTAAVVMATLRGELRGREPELGGRAIAAEALRKAIAVSALSLLIVLTVVLLLTLTEDQPFIRLVFEAVSAFATVGLSTGITASLTVAGKLIIAAAMFVGRVGPFTIALAAATAARPSATAWPARPGDRVTSAGRLATIPAACRTVTSSSGSGASGRRWPSRSASAGPRSSPSTRTWRRSRRSSARWPTRSSSTRPTPRRCSRSTRCAARR